MPVYTYRALNNRSLAASGSIAAETPRKARDLLRSRGLVVQDLDLQKSKSSLWSKFGRRRTRSLALATATRELATLLSVGIPVVDALDTLTQQYRGGLRTSVLTLRDRVSGGASLSEAAAGQPELFDELSVRMIEVGETSGTLDVVLHRLADFQERSLEFKDRILGVPLYPAIVLATSLLVTGFLMVVVLPMLLDQLIEAGHPLPWPTKVLKFVSDSLVNYGLVVSLGLIGITFLVAFLLRLPAGKRLAAKILIRVPVVGSMMMRQHLARIAYVLATLLATGVDFVKAAAIAARGTRNVLYRDALLAAGEAIHTGQEIGVALERTGVFPPMVVQVFTVGQASGHLETMLERLAVTYDKQVASLAGRIATVIEPVMILFLAIVIGFILFATILPILEASNVV